MYLNILSSRIKAHARHQTKKMATGNAIVLDSMRRLYKVYEETGGKELQVKDQLDDETRKNVFEASKILLVRKLDVTREVGF